MLSTRVEIFCSFSCISNVHNKFYTGNDVQHLILMKLSSFSALKNGDMYGEIWEDIIMVLFKFYLNCSEKKNENTSTYCLF